MRELFVYYRVGTDQANALQAAACAMQTRLRARHPGLSTRLMRRADETAGDQTWMETYAFIGAPSRDGVTPSLQDAIEAEAEVLSALLSGPRHTEVFIATRP